MCSFAYIKLYNTYISNILLWKTDRSNHFDGKATTVVYIVLENFLYYTYNETDVYTENENKRNVENHPQKATRHDPAFRSIVSQTQQNLGTVASERDDEK